MKYFTIDELCKSNTARAKKIPNYPQSEEVFDNLRALVDNILDPAREKLGRPIYVNSGYRCPKVNEMVGGVKNSQHMKGQAADIFCSGDMTELWNILLTTDFDQLIVYKHKHFFHVSYNKDHNRRQILSL